MNNKYERLGYIDNLRAVLMLYGIVVHSLTLGDVSVKEALLYPSSLVRMECFFIISGLVATLFYEKYGALETFKMRVNRIGIPLLFGIIIIVPSANILIKSYTNQIPITESFNLYISPNLQFYEDKMSWHLHLWFLIPLLIYTPITLIGKKITKAIYTISDKPNIVFLILFLALSSTILRASYAYTTNTTTLDFSFIIRETLYQSSFFLLGCILANSKNLFLDFKSNNSLFFSAIVPLIALSIYFRNSELGNLLKLASIFNEAIIAFILSSFLIQVFERLGKLDGPVMKIVIRSSYTTYILHYLVIYMFALTYNNFELPSEILIPFVGLSTIICTTLFHKYAVEKNSILSKLLNGK
jgi:glucan biosynthesis protein C